MALRGPWGGLQEAGDTEGSLGVLAAPSGRRWDVIGAVLGLLGVIWKSLGNEWGRLWEPPESKERPRGVVGTSLERS